MKLNSFWSILLLVTTLGIAMFFSSCSKDDEEDIKFNSLNGHTFVSYGYKGTYSGTDYYYRLDFSEKTCEYSIREGLPNGSINSLYNFVGEYTYSYPNITIEKYGATGKSTTGYFTDKNTIRIDGQDYELYK